MHADIFVMLDTWNQNKVHLRGTSIPVRCVWSDLTQALPTYHAAFFSNYTPSPTHCDAWLVCVVSGTWVDQVRMTATLRHAGKAMATTSVSTCFAFFANATSSFPAVYVVLL